MKLFLQSSFGLTFPGKFLSIPETSSKLFRTPLASTSLAQAQMLAAFLGGLLYRVQTIIIVIKRYTKLLKSSKKFEYILEMN
jgi:hypothetical protein